MNKSKFDPLLLCGLPRIHDTNELDSKRLRFYKILFNTTVAIGFISFILAFVFLQMIISSSGNVAESGFFYTLAFILSFLFFIVFCIMYTGILIAFLTQRNKRLVDIVHTQDLVNLTPIKSTLKSSIIKYINIFFAIFGSVIFGILGVSVSIGFLTYFFIFLVPRIRILYATSEGNLYAEFAILCVSLGFYEIKNDESLYYCEFYNSQSTLPIIKICQLVRCTCDNGILRKQRAFAFAKTIDSTKIIDFFGKRVILQSKTQNAQNTKINIKELE